MALQRNSNLFSGITGNVVFFNYNGKQGIRVRPVRVKQTPAMKKNAKEFGRAATLSSHIRSGLKDFVPDPKEKKLRYGLDHCLKKWMAGQSAAPGQATGFTSLNGFELNTQSLLKDQMRVLPSVEWVAANDISITLPALTPTTDIVAPRGTTSIQFRFRAIRCNTGRDIDLDDMAETTIDLPYTDLPVPSRSVSLSLFPRGVPRHHLVVVFVALEYQLQSMKIDDAKWRPAMLIGHRVKE
jgi:hypothetical protein